MSQLVQRNLPVLRKLCKCKPGQRRKIFLEGGKDIKTCLSECALNILKGTVKLGPTQFKKLAKHKHLVRALSKKKVTYKKAEDIVQQGGFLPLLLSPILGALTSAAIKGIGNAIKKKKKQKK